MEDPGRAARCVLPDGRSVDYWDGGDPEGRGVLFHPGSPCTRVMGRQGHEAALELGVRLVSVSRPGYGGSDLPAGAPSLRATGADTADLARQLGMRAYAVLGASGGGPFAVATAVADPAGVRSLGVVAGTGPWAILNEPTDDDAEERALLTIADGGDAETALAGYRALLDRELSGLRDLDDEARVDAFFAGAPHLPDLYGARPLWVANLAEVVARPDGLAVDNLAWGSRWDVDPRDVRVPTSLWYGDADVLVPASHGRWYADRIAHAELTILPGEGHAEVCSNRWRDQLSHLLEGWAHP